MYTSWKQGETGTFSREKQGEKQGHSGLFLSDWPQELSVAEIRRLIAEAGRIPVERDTLYHEVIRTDDRWQTGRSLHLATVPANGPQVATSEAKPLANGILNVFIPFPFPVPVFRLSPVPFSARSIGHRVRSTPCAALELSIHLFLLSSKGLIVDKNSLPRNRVHSQAGKR
jgi:hypothetical protein